MPTGHPGTSRSTRATRDDPAAAAFQRTTLDALFLESTVIWASSTALLGEEGRLSYSDLMVRAQNVAAVLRARGMRHGDLVGVIGRRSFNSISAIVGILLAGGVYVPFDVHAMTAERLVRQLDESAVQILVTDSGDPAASVLPWARRVLLVDVARVEREFMPLFKEVGLSPRVPEDPAAVLFNEEGRGVLITHHGLVRLVTTGALLKFTPSDTVLLHAGAQQHGFQLELWGALLSGGTLALAPHSLDRTLETGPHREPKSDPSSSLSHSPWSTTDTLPAYEYGRMLRRYRVSALCAEPVLLAELAQDPMAPLARVKQAVYDAAGLRPALIDPLQEWEPRIRLTGALGAAETTSFAVTVQLNGKDGEQNTAPIPGSDAMVVTADLAEAPAGALGSLAITGDSLAIGYLGQPEATLAAFPEARRAGGERTRCYRLPVQAIRLVDGRLLTGAAAIAAVEELERTRDARRHEMEALLRQHPLVQECVAIATEDGDRIRCVFATLHTGDDPRAERTLREHLEARLEPAARPEALVLLPRMPLDAAGEPDRARLTDQCEALLRRYTTPPRPAGIPTSRHAEVVRSIWQRLLHRMQVDLDEDFFSSGGTAVQQIRLQAELNQRFPGAFTSGELPQLNTIRKILDHLATDTVQQRMQTLERRGA
jgi:acyl-CoA synthetase (AMP-forming)/AMP-acid ligase II